MTIKKAAALLSAAALFMTSFGCTKKTATDTYRNIKEFTGFYAARHTEINEDNNDSK